jgi:hypothetical protein
VQRATEELGVCERAEPTIRDPPFPISMSLKTVTALSAKWHEAVALGMDGHAATFPPPWYSPAKIGDYDFCRSTIAPPSIVKAPRCIIVSPLTPTRSSGSLYVYGVRRDGQRMATLALARDPTSTKARLLQLRGLCNAQPSRAVTLAVQRWLRGQGPFRAAGIDESRRVA